MNKKIFAIVGYTNWGKSNTLYDLFDRKQFFPLKSPISTDYFKGKKFTVVNASNEDRPTEKYLDRLQSILKKHEHEDTIFVITISVIFNAGTHAVNDVFNYLNSLESYELHYLILVSGWYKNSTLKLEDTMRMEDNIKKGAIKYLPEIINQSKQNFSGRTKKIASYVARCLQKI